MKTNWNQMTNEEQKIAVASTKSRMGRVSWKPEGIVPPKQITKTSDIKWWCSTKNWVVTENDAHPVSKIDWDA